MWNEFKDKIDRLHSSVKNMLSRGSLNSVTNAPTATMQVQLMAGETNDGIEFPQDYGFISSPPAGSQVITAHFAGDRDHGTVLKAFHTKYAPQTLSPGETALYHMSGSIILCKADGSIHITPSGGTVFVNGSINATGDIIDNSGSNSHNVKAMRTIYNEHEHPSPGTSAPTPTQ